MKVAGRKAKLSVRHVRKGRDATPLCCRARVYLHITEHSPCVVTRAVIKSRQVGLTRDSPVRSESVPSEQVFGLTKQNKP